MVTQPENPFFHVRETGHRSVIEFDQSIAETSDRTQELQSELSQFLFTSDCKVLIIDLTNTRYLPSTVLGVLTVLRKGGTELHLANAPPDVVEIMQVTKLDSLIHVNDIRLPPGRQATSVTAIDTAVKSTKVTKTAVKGYFVPCRYCAAEQKVDKHSLGHDVRCQSCQRDFHVRADLLQAAMYLFLDCPHCKRELRFARKYLSKPVACNFCDGVLEIHMYL